MRREKQRKIIEVDRGLYLVRYATAEDAALPPRIALAPDAASQRLVELITPPGDDEAALCRPGACLVVRASAPGKLIVEATPQNDSVSAAAAVRLEPLTQGRSEPVESAASRFEARPVDLASFFLTGHVAGLGDVRVGPGEWLAGPTAPSRIEGIKIDWDERPDGVDLRYSVTTARPQAISQRLMKLGDFAGTRGKALAVVGLALELGGQTSTAQFSVEAIFLGSPGIRRSGQRVFLAGPTGREPLVGLKIGVEAAGQSVPAQPRSAPPRLNSADGRVRVFRGRSKSARPDGIGRKAPASEGRAREI